MNSLRRRYKRVLPSRSMAAGDALTALERHALLWLIGQGDFEPIVRSACDVLVAGADGEALAALAGMSVTADRWSSDVEQAVFDALSEQGRALPPRGTEQAEAAAVVALCGDVLAGRMTPRDLAAWAHRVVGHGGAAMAQPLVDLDDRYDMTEHTAETEEQLDAEVQQFCRQVAHR